MPNWEALVREHGPAVYQSAWRVLRNAQDAEDVTQEVLLRLFQRPPLSSMSPGLLACMAVRRAIETLRRRRTTRGLTETVALAGQSCPLDEAMGRELQQRLRLAVAALPPRQAEVFCLRFLQDLTYEQIARELGISRDAVAMALYQARQALRSSLGSEMEESYR